MRHNYPLQWLTTWQCLSLYRHQIDLLGDVAGELRSNGGGVATFVGFFLHHQAESSARALFKESRLLEQSSNFVLHQTDQSQTNLKGNYLDTTSVS